MVLIWTGGLVWTWELGIDRSASWQDWKHCSSMLKYSEHKATILKKNCATPSTETETDNLVRRSNAPNDLF